MRVEVDVFSGRPNPVWDLTPDEADAVRRILAALPAAPEVAASGYDGLGYRGFRVEDSESDRTLTGWRDTVVARQDVVAAVKVDARRELERFLLRTAQTRLDAALYATVRGQVEPKAP